MVNEKQKIEELQNLARYKPNEALIAVKKMIKKYPYFMAARVLELDILKTSNQKGYKHTPQNQTKYGYYGNLQLNLIICG